MFKEMRADSAKAINPSLEDKPLHTKERKSYLKLIKALLKKLNIEPSERGNAKGLERMVTEVGQSLGDDKIRDILKEVQDLDED